jgi:hypothetical protein
MKWYKVLYGKIRYYLARRKWKPQTAPIYCYYGEYADQLNEVKDHVQLYHVVPWGQDQAKKIQECKEAGLPVMYSPANLDPERLREDFLYLRTLGLLDQIKFLYPCDEPNFNPPPNIRQVKSVAAEFPELSDVKYAVIYAGTNQNWIDLHEYDYVGIDSYDRQEHVLNLDMLDLRKALLPSQKMILVPGGASPYHNDPRPFFKRALEDDKVGMVCAFAWFDPSVPDKTFSAGIRSNGMKSLYENGIK